MAITVTTTQNTQFGSSGGTSASLDTTGCTLLVVSLVYQKAGGSNLTDSKGNTWTALTAYEGPSVAGARIYYCDNPTVGTGHTFSTTSKLGGLTVFGITGDATSAYDVENGQFENTGQSTWGAGNTTPSVNDCILITSVYQQSAGAAPSLPSGYTGYVWAVGTAFPGGAGYKIQTTATTENPLWSINSAADAIANIAVFKPAVSSTGRASRLAVLGVA